MAVSPSNLRKKVELAFREYRAILILTGGLTATERKGLDAFLSALPTIPRQQLQTEQSKIQAELNYWRRYLGAKRRLKDYELILGHKSDRPGQVVYVPKYLMQSFFEHYDRIMSIFPSLPLHARIAVDIEGVLTHQHREIGWTLLEAKLFEDLAMLWNESLDAERRLDGSKTAAKRHEALLRATTRAVFHLIEGYVNGVAVDIILLRKGELSDEQRATLLDDKARRLSLRQKLLQFPKIAAGAQHPPLQESNCPDMKLIVDYEVRLRHALVHPTPRVDEDETSEVRESVFFGLTTDQVVTLIDAVIGLIRRIAGAIGDSFGDVNLWIRNRDTTGRFDEEVFR